MRMDTASEEAGVAMDSLASGSFAMGPAAGRPAQPDAPRSTTVATGSPGPSGPPPTATDAATSVTAEPIKPAAPLLIYTATLQLSVFQVAEALDKAFAVAQELGGYLVSRSNNAITFRVPAEKYRQALSAAAALGDVVSRNESVQDVTDQFRDLETQLKNARAVRARLEQLLSQANNVAEALKVEEQLGRVTAQIESFEGKLKRMRELIRFSTLTVQFSPRQTDHVAPRVRLPFDWLHQLGLSPLLSL